jgi:hypothetical protein
MIHYLELILNRTTLDDPNFYIRKRWSNNFRTFYSSVIIVLSFRKKFSTVLFTDGPIFTTPSVSNTESSTQFPVESYNFWVNNFFTKLSRQYILVPILNNNEKQSLYKIKVSSGFEPLELEISYKLLVVQTGRINCALFHTLPWLSPSS